MGTGVDFAHASSLVRAANTVAVFGHVRPDADAIGSVSTMVQACRALGKEASGWIGQSQPFAANLLTIPLADHIYCTDTLPAADLYIVVDCGSLDRTGSFAAALGERTVPMIMVDHHASNPAFGDVNLLDTHAESTTTILRAWLQDLGVELSPEIAHSIYAGLVTDTGSFRWGRPEMHQLAQELVAAGANSRQIAAELIDATSLAGLRLIGTVLSNIEIAHAGQYQVAMLTATHADIQGIDISEVEGLVEYVRAVGQTDIGAVFKEYEPDWFAVSLRTARDIDVSQIACALGGGGHKRAAGYTTAGTEAVAKRELLDVIAQGQG